MAAITGVGLGGSQAAYLAFQPKATAAIVITTGGSHWVGYEPRHLYRPDWERAPKKRPVAEPEPVIVLPEQPIVLPPVVSAPPVVKRQGRWRVPALRPPPLPPVARAAPVPVVQARAAPSAAAVRREADDEAALIAIMKAVLDDDDDD